MNIRKNVSQQRGNSFSSTQWGKRRLHHELYKTAPTTISARKYQPTNNKLSTNSHLHHQFQLR